MSLNWDGPNPSSSDSSGRSSLDRANRNTTFSRREFVGMTAASLLMAGTLGGATAPDRKNGIPYRPLGRTGQKVSLIGLGGYHLARQSDTQESIRIIRTGLDEGINFLDNCWDYNGGESEIRMGKALRDQVFQVDEGMMLERLVHELASEPKATPPLFAAQLSFEM